MRTILGAIAVLCACTIASADWQENSTSTLQSQTLAKVVELVKNTKNPVVIFDLDSTLFDPRSRYANIIADFGKTKGLTQLEGITKNDMVDSFQMEPNFAKAMKTSTEEIAQYMPEFREFWAQHFFGNEYVADDEALPGSPEFVNTLYKNGATIVYLTSRNDEGMRKGTEKALTKYNFPINQERVHLFMKGTHNKHIVTAGDNQSEGLAKLRKHDVNWKQTYINTIKKLGTVVASFENEPGNLNILYNSFHKEGFGVGVFIDTDHFPGNDTPVAEGAIAIRGYLR